MASKADELVKDVRRALAAEADARSNYERAKEVAGRAEEIMYKAEEAVGDALHALRQYALEQAE